MIHMMNRCTHPSDPLGELICTWLAKICANEPPKPDPTYKLSTLCITVAQLSKLWTRQRQDWALGISKVLILLLGARPGAGPERSLERFRLNKQTEVFQTLFFIVEEQQSLHSLSLCLSATHKQTMCVFTRQRGREGVKGTQCFCKLFSKLLLT